MLNNDRKLTEEYKQKINEKKKEVNLKTECSRKSIAPTIKMPESDTFYNRYYKR